MEDDDDAPPPVLGVLLEADDFLLLEEAAPPSAGVDAVSFDFLTLPLPAGAFEFCAGGSDELLLAVSE